MMAITDDKTCKFRTSSSIYFSLVLPSFSQPAGLRCAVGRAPD